MTHPWHPIDPQDEAEPAQSAPARPDSIEAWADLFATTIAHLAAQLTMTQLRLRALATVTARTGAADAAEVTQELGDLAARETRRYLRENLGPELSDAIELDALEHDIIDFLQSGHE